MTLTYTLTVAEFQEARRVRKRHVIVDSAASPAKARSQLTLRLARIAGALLVVGSMLVFAGCIYFGMGNSGSFLIWSFLFVLFCISLFAMLLRKLNSESLKLFESNDKLGGPFTLEVSEAGISYLGPTWSATLAWPAIFSLAESQSLYIVISQIHEPVAVPKRVLADKAQGDAFVGEFRSYLNAG